MMELALPNAHALAVMILIVVALVLFGLLWRAGLRRYSAVGG